MTHLYIEQDNNVEVVTAQILKKLYDIASSNDIETCVLKGNLLSQHCHDYVYDYLTGKVSVDEYRFPNLSLNITDGIYISFADSVIANYWINSSYGDGTGITNIAAQSVTIFPKRLTTQNLAIGALDLYNLGQYAFYGDETITSFNELGRFTNITNIPTSMFRGSSLQHIDLSNITSIEAAAFTGSNLTGVVNIPKFTTWGGRTNSTSRNIDCQYFGDNLNMTEINIGSQVPAGQRFTKLERFTFSNCTSLTKVTGLDNVNNIDTRAFYGCSNLSSIDIDWSKILNIGAESFYGCKNISSIEDISIPNLTYLGSSAFRGCTSIKTISNLGLITSLVENTFHDCDKVTSYTLPATLKLFHCEAFYGCDIDSIIGIEGIETMVFGQYNNKNKNFKYIELPSTVTDMGRFFHNSLNSLNTSNKAVCVIKATTPPSLGYYNSQGGGVVYDSTAAGASILGTINGASRCFSGIYVPNNSLNDYLAAPGAWLESEIQDRLKPISQLETDSPSNWAIYQQGLSNQ